MWTLIPSTAKRLALTLAAQNLSTALVSGKFYMLTANQDLYFNQAGAATAADGNALVPARVPTLIQGAAGATISVLGLVAGDVTITEVALMNFFT